MRNSKIIKLSAAKTALIFCAFALCYSANSFAQQNGFAGKSKVLPDAMLLRDSPDFKKFQSINIRGAYINSLSAFKNNKSATVAFLGGSITEMNGYSVYVCDWLEKTFPNCKFNFIRAGISSTGTTPGAFRINNDILSKGKIDLLFVEGAVNDDTNMFPPKRQIRGMEGEVRRALIANPYCDIVMLHFVYEPFLEEMKSGRTPDVISNHESVARHYKISSINLAEEIYNRMRLGEFDWKDFGGTHPKPFGHKYYTAAIANLLEASWGGELKAPDFSALRPHEIPPAMDPFSYFGGELVDVSKASADSSWKILDSWRPQDKYAKRKGFVDVKMLETKTAGASLEFVFDGSAVGVFCVAGPSAGIIEYSIDGKDYPPLDTYTKWSGNLYIPWLYVLADELSIGRHILKMKISEDKNPKSLGHEIQIRNFAVNGN